MYRAWDNGQTVTLEPTFHAEPYVISWPCLSMAVTLFAEMNFGWCLVPAAPLIAFGARVSGRDAGW